MSENSQNLQFRQRWCGFSKSAVDWLGMAGIAAAMPLMFIQLSNLWSKQHLQFFPFAWIAFGVLLVTRGWVGTTQNKLRWIVGTAILVLSLIATCLSVIRFSPWLIHVAGSLLLVGWMLMRLGGTPWHSVIAWGALLFVAVPLPMNLDVTLVQSLQQLSSKSASALLDLSGVPHLLKGNVIQTGNRELFVDQACSGVDSLYALFAALLIFLIFQRESLLVSVVMLLILPLWAWAGNLTRLYTIAMVDDLWKVDLTSGWQHTTIGLAIFVLVFMCVMATHKSLSAFLGPMNFSSDFAYRLHNAVVRWPRKSSSDKSAVKPEVLESPGDKKTVWIPCIVGIVGFLALGAISLGPFLRIGPWKKFQFSEIKYDRGNVEAMLSQSTLPTVLQDSIQIVGFDITHRESNHFMGEFSTTWVAQDGEYRILLSLDFPFAYYHPLDDCYVLTGSTKLKMEDHELSTAAGPVYFKHAYYSDQTDQPTFMMFTLFYADGQSMKENNKLVERLFPEQPRGLIYQLQVFLSNSSDISEEKKLQYQELLIDLKNRLLPIINQLASGDG
jgi:exosortase